MQAQARADADYFRNIANTPCSATQREQVHAIELKAYRWQYIVSGAIDRRFPKTLFGMLDAAQIARIQVALAPLSYAVPTQPDPLPMAA